MASSAMVAMAAMVPMCGPHRVVHGVVWPMTSSYCRHHSAMVIMSRVHLPVQTTHTSERERESQIHIYILYGFVEYLRKQPVHLTSSLTPDFARLNPLKNVWHSVPPCTLYAPLCVQNVRCNSTSMITMWAHIQNKTHLHL